MHCTCTMHTDRLALVITGIYPTPTPPVFLWNQSFTCLTGHMHLIIRRKPGSCIVSLQAASRWPVRTLCAHGQSSRSAGCACTQDDL